MIRDIQERTDWVRREALQLGFSQLGFSAADSLQTDGGRLQDWLKAGYHGEMSYMENHFEARTDPRKLVPGAQSVISLSYNYFTPGKQEDPDAPVLSVYAYGRDYHTVIRKKLKKLLAAMNENLGPVAGRFFTDSAPVMERVWAHRSGLGWIGKNTLLIHPQKGSYFFLAELIVDMAFAYDEAMEDHCGRCRRCIEACPTGAIHPDGYILRAKDCISYATIEKKGPIPESFRNKMKNRVFGCDICMEVCPWNKFATPHREADFEPSEELMQMRRKDWLEMDEERYERLFTGSPVKRVKFEGLRRNIDYISKQNDATA